MSPKSTHALHYLAALAALPAAGAVAWSFGDARGVGLLVGVCSALAISLVGWRAQDLSLRRGGASATGVMTVFALTFLVKLFVIALGAVVLRLQEDVAPLCDWRAFLLGFAAAVVWVLFVGAFRRFGAVRTPKEASASC
jgi:hypothetical protein